MNILITPQDKVSPVWKAYAYIEKKWPKDETQFLAIDLADLYWEVCAWAGVHPDVAFCQMAKETGYLQFGRAVTIDMHNPCGLKVREPGADDAQESHARFPNWATGVTAHIDHLALYAGAEGYPVGSHNDKAQATADTRHFSWVYGKAPTVEDLGGKWAPNKYYGEDIVSRVKDLREVL